MLRHALIASDFPEGTENRLVSDKPIQANENVMMIQSGLINTHTHI